MITPRVLLVQAIVAGSALVLGAAPSQADAGYCNLTGMTKYRWTSTATSGTGTLWSVASNWSPAHVPGQGDMATGYVCIPAGRTVIADAYVSAHIQAIDIAGTARLTLQRGSKLYVFGSKTTRPSYFRQGSNVTVSGATLGGTGAYVVSGQLKWNSESAGGTSTILSRPCRMTNTCSGTLPSGGGGQLTVTDSGTLAIAQGATSPGVQLRDQFRLVVRGQATIHPDGYVAADDGTVTELRPREDGAGLGQLTINGNGGFYQGFLFPALGLPKLVNEGRLIKASGVGNSTMEVTYQRIPTVVGVLIAGEAQVDSGSLSLPGGAPVPALVAGSASLSTGTCHVYGCAPVPTGTDTLITTVQVPGTDTNGATMTIAETTETGPAGSFTPPARLQAAGLDASLAAPAVLTLKYDKKVIGTRAIADIGVWRKPESATSYTKVVNCNTGAIPAGQTACVDRRPTWSKKVNGDAYLTVRTTGFSRWVARDNSFT
ncbi:MAG: hypothetical protein V9G19_16245 [Tetrasphaera sp.]